MSDNEKKYLSLRLEDEKVDISDEETVMPEHSLLMKNGRYYWIAELPMGKSFFLLFEVWRVLGIAGLAVLFISFIISLLSGSITSFLGTAGVILLCTGIILVLSIPSYYIVTRVNDGKYTVLFEMDDKGIDHIQIKTAKAEALDMLTMMTASVTSSNALKGLGIKNSEGASLYSPFKNVRKIKADKGKGLIRLYGRFMRNQIYVDEENFDYVYDFIRKRCTDVGNK